MPRVKSARAGGFGRVGARLAAASAVILFAASAVAADPLPPGVPDLFDPDHHTTQPDLGPVKSIRFLTTDDFPPFHFTLPDGTLTGFDIDFARAICHDLKLACTIQARRFDTLIGEIKTGKDDALIAAVANTPATRNDLAFTDPYYTTPARFVAKLKSKLDGKTPLAKMTPEALAGHVIGVEAGTAHEAYLKAFFPKVTLKTYRSQPDLRTALQKDEVDAIFADGIGLALWLNGSDSNGCCGFRDGPFTESRFFGNGVSIAVAKTNIPLRQALDFEFEKLVRDGTYADLYLKWFPIGFY